MLHEKVGKHGGGTEVLSGGSKLIEQTLFSVSLSHGLVFPGRLCSKPFQYILDIVGQGQAEL